MLHLSVSTNGPDVQRIGCALHNTLFASQQFPFINLLLMNCDTVSPGRAQPQRVVLPEALDPRVLTASAELAARGLARVVLLGQPERVAAQARKLGVDIAKARGLPVVHGREAMLLRMISIGMHGCRAQSSSGSVADRVI